MIRAWWADQGLFWGPMVTTLAFLALFIGVLFWIYRPGSREAYQRTANMPLENDAPTPLSGNDSENGNDK